MPVIDGKAGNSGSSAWNDLIQFKTLDNGVKCAFRWSKYTSGGYSYLKIDCIVVPKGMTDTSAVDWTDENVETRYFKGQVIFRPIAIYGIFHLLQEFRHNIPHVLLNGGHTAAQLEEAVMQVLSSYLRLQAICVMAVFIGLLMLYKVYCQCLPPSSDVAAQWCEMQ